MKNDIAYENGNFIPGANDYPDRWARTARDWRENALARGRAELDLPYGVTDRERFDLFRPGGDSRGLVVFIHGGYWRRFGRKDWSHLAAGPTTRGWAVAMPSYSLAPEARINAITRQVAQAVEVAAGCVAGPVRIAGHSAGGHLAARMNCADVALSAGLAARLARIVPISPVADLRPLLETSMNADLRLDPTEAAAESPTLARRTRSVAVTVWVGAEERPAFLDQARRLAGAWDEAGLRIAPGRHHFDVIEQMSEPDSPLTHAILS